MATLTHVAYVSRKIIRFSGVIVATFIILYYSVTAAVKAYRAAHPPYVPPTVRYGQLPPIVFPEKTFTKKNFALELQNDAFPKFKDQAKVYVVYRPTSSFRALEYDTQTAKDLGFINQPQEVSTGIYEFKNDQANLTLQMNVLEGSFRLQYPYLQDQLLLTPGLVPTKDIAIRNAKSFLENVDKYPSDLDDGEHKVTYWKIAFSGLESVAAPADANIARVDFFRTKLEEQYEIMSTELNRAAISVLVTGSEVEAKKIAEVNYKYVQIDRDSFSTYPIKTPEAAYEDLKVGNYWPLNDVAASDVAIRRVKLAYFEPITLTNFMQPIYVFEGDGNFVAYVSAVTDKWISSSN